MSIILAPSYGTPVRYLAEMLTLDPEDYARSSSDEKAKFTLVATVLIDRGEDDAQEIRVLQRGYVDPESVSVLLPPEDATPHPPNDLCEEVLSTVAENLEAQSDEKAKRYDLTARERTDDGCIVRHPELGDILAPFPKSLSVKEESPATDGVPETERPFSLFSVTYKQPPARRPARPTPLLFRLAYVVEFSVEDFILRNCPNFAEVEILSPAQVLHNLRKETQEKLKTSAAAQKTYMEALDTVLSAWGEHPYDYEIALTTEDEKSRLSAEYHAYIRCFPMRSSRPIQLIRPRRPDSSYAVEVKCLTGADYCDVRGVAEQLAGIKIEIEGIQKKLSRGGYS